MQITFRPADISTIDDCSWLAKWEADLRIRHLLIPFRDQAAFASVKTAEEMWKTRVDRKTRRPQGEELMIRVDGKMAGSASWDLDPPHSLFNFSRSETDGPTAWLGITIGEEWARGKGVGKQVVAELERRARAGGAERAEAGVFEFNEPSRRLFLGAGYRQFGKVPEITWWQGRMWEDLRFIKDLRAQA